VYDNSDLQKVEKILISEFKYFTFSDLYFKLTQIDLFTKSNMKLKIANDSFSLSN